MTPMSFRTNSGTKSSVQNMKNVVGSMKKDKEKTHNYLFEGKKLQIEYLDWTLMKNMFFAGSAAQMVFGIWTRVNIESMPSFLFTSDEKNAVSPLVSVLVSGFLGSVMTAVTEGCKEGNQHFNSLSNLEIYYNTKTYKKYLVLTAFQIGLTCLSNIVTGPSPAKTIMDGIQTAGGLPITLPIYYIADYIIEKFQPLPKELNKLTLEKNDFIQQEAQNFSQEAIVEIEQNPLQEEKIESLIPALNFNSIAARETFLEEKQVQTTPMLKRNRVDEIPLTPTHFPSTITA